MWKFCFLWIPHDMKHARSFHHFVTCIDDPWESWGKKYSTHRVYTGPSARVLLIILPVHDIVWHVSYIWLHKHILRSKSVAQVLNIIIIESTSAEHKRTAHIHMKQTRVQSRKRSICTHTQISPYIHTHSHWAEEVRGAAEEAHRVHTSHGRRTVNKKHVWFSVILRTPNKVYRTTSAGLFEAPTVASNTFHIQACRVRKRVTCASVRCRLISLCWHLG